MPIWSVNPVADEPETQLAAWQVMEVPDGSRHLVGYALNAREGRVSTAVQQFDAERLRAVTRSGRVYELVGRPGCDSDADYVWALWRSLNKVEAFTDVTEAVWAAHVVAIAARPPNTGASQ